MWDAIDLSKEPIAIIGTGMMATGIAILYSRSGLNIHIGSRDPLRGEQFANRISEQIQNSTNVGNIQGGSIFDALNKCRIIILAVPTLVKDENNVVQDGVVHFLKQHDKQIRGKNKILVDITYYGRNFGNPSPSNGYTSALTYHANEFGDKNTFWVGGYKSVMWTSLRDSKLQGIEIAGDVVGRMIFGKIIAKTGFKPLDCGGLSTAGVIEPGGPDRKPHPEASV